MLRCPCCVSGTAHTEPAPSVQLAAAKGFIHECLLKFSCIQLPGFWGLGWLFVMVLNKELRFLHWMMRRWSQGCRPRQSQSSGQDADGSSGAACAVRPHRSSLWGAAYLGHHRPCSRQSLSATELRFAQRGEGFSARPLLAGIVTSGVAGGNDAVWRSHPRRDVLVLCETDQINTMKSP